MVHFDEFHSPGGHDIDKHAGVAVLMDVEVQDWLRGMAEASLIPLKRSAR